MGLSGTTRAKGSASRGIMTTFVESASPWFAWISLINFIFGVVFFHAHKQSRTHLAIDFTFMIVCFAIFAAYSKEFPL